MEEGERMSKMSVREAINYVFASNKYAREHKDEIGFDGTSPEVKAVAQLPAFRGTSLSPEAIRQRIRERG